jgi:hypothetical protein
MDDMFDMFDIFLRRAVCFGGGENGFRGVGVLSVMISVF